MMRANQEPDLLNQLCPEAYELECHAQQCWKQQWDQEKLKLKNFQGIIIDPRVTDDFSKSCFCAVAWFSTLIGTYKNYDLKGIHSVVCKLFFPNTLLKNERLQLRLELLMINGARFFSLE